MKLSSVVSGVLLGFGLAAAAPEPERKVDKNIVTSERDPKVRIALPDPVQYVGVDRWVLLNMADCELHAFVEAGSSSLRARTQRSMAVATNLTI